MHLSTVLLSYETYFDWILPPFSCIIVEQPKVEEEHSEKFDFKIIFFLKISMPIIEGRKVRGSPSLE